MSTVALPTLESPSKRAAADFESMSLSTPTKPELSPLDKFIAENSSEASSSKLSLEVVPAKVEEPVEEYRTRFVGQVDLEEKDEPLLKESSRRFVLFPIQYHEVCFSFFRSLATRPDAFFSRGRRRCHHLCFILFCAPRSLPFASSDLADVQEG